ncbi:hypothetical protein VXJ36_16930 [Pseudomonas nitroreducens]|uniref:hypothetical protein n=1 Tax=Pseudomonas TaxID=286 RepID=UPI002F356DCF
MSKYASQVIISFLSGAGDSTIINGTNAIITKGNSFGVPSYSFIANDSTPPAIAQVVSVTMAPWRLYLRGHGSHSRQLLGPCRAEDVAYFLNHCGLSANMPDVISVTGCKLGLGVNQSKTEVHYQASHDSFVGRLHFLLGRTYNIYTTMHGRTMNNSVIKQGPNTGRKRTRHPSGNLANHRPFAKVTFTWDSALNQQVKFSYEEMDIDADDVDAMDIDVDSMDVD